MVFDRVIANPPFSLDEWGRRDGRARPLRPLPVRHPAQDQRGFGLRSAHGRDDQRSRDGRRGHAPRRPVSGAAEGDIRKGLLQEDLVESVVGLPTNLFYGTGIPAAILILNRSKKADRKRKVLFIEASREGSSKAPPRTTSETKTFEEIATTFHAFKDVEKYAKVVGLEEVERNDWNLNISRYVETTDAAEKIDVSHAWRSSGSLRGSEERPKPG
jgi:type I restriction enzyme M protein